MVSWLSFVQTTHGRRCDCSGHSDMLRSGLETRIRVCYATKHCAPYGRFSQLAIARAELALIRFIGSKLRQSLSAITFLPNRYLRTTGQAKDESERPQKVAATEPATIVQRRDAKSGGTMQYTFLTRERRQIDSGSRSQPPIVTLTSRDNRRDSS